MKILSSLRNWIVDDFGWKFFSVILAVIIWLTVHKILDEAKTTAASTSITTLTYDNLPVRIVSSTADVQLYRVAPPGVSVVVSGPGDVMESLSIGQIRATVDLTGLTNSATPRRPVEISVPPGVTILKVTPQEVGILIPPAP